ncbi:MAG: hypothetical protein ACYC5N_06380 [Endomicrobiales bacterium]
MTALIRRLSLFPSSVRPSRNGVLMFSILFVDIALLLFSAYTLAAELERRVRRPLAPAAVSPSVPGQAARAPGTLARLGGHWGGVPETLVFDDFSRWGRNRLDGTVRFFSRYGGACRGKFLPADAGGACLRLAYDVSTRSSSSGYVSSLEGLNLEGYRALEFQVRGENGDEVFEIRLGDGIRGAKIPVCRIFPESVPRTWRKVSLPLAEFSAVENWREMRGELALFFSHGQGMPYRGAIYIKDITFVK